MKEPIKIPEPDWMRVIILECKWYESARKRINNKKYFQEYLEEMKKTIKIVGT